MTPMKARNWLASGLTALLVAAAGTANAAGSLITVATGDVTGVYYLAGGGICSLVNSTGKDYPIRCTVASTSGSVENLRALRDGEMAFGFAQADVVQQAYKGQGFFTNIFGFRDLRTVFAVGTQTFTVVVREEAGVDDVRDLRNLRVNLGARTSGEAATMDSFMDALGWTKNDFASTTRLSNTAQVEAFCDGEIDVAIFVTAHPNPDVKQTLRCGGTLVPIEGPAINGLARTAPYYNTRVIPAGTYEGVSTDIPTFGVVSLFMASTHTDPRVVREVAEAVFENLEAFRDWHPSLNTLEPGTMASRTQSVDVPLHTGAKTYFKLNGLL